LTAADAVLNAPVRVRPIGRWRLRVARVATSLVLAIGAGGWLLSTDELDAFAAVLVGHPLRTVATHGRDAVALIVRAPAGEVRAVAAALHRDGVRASFASTLVPRPATLRLLERFGDEAIPSINRGSLFHWMGTAGALRREARGLHLHRHFFYLVPGNATVGQLLLAHVDGAVPVVGSAQLAVGTQLSARSLRSGDVLVLTLSGSARALRAVDRVALALSAERLSALPFSVLAR
jgi:hypothetical protein